MRITLNDGLVEDRITYFAQKSDDIEKTSERAHRLLQSSPCWKAPLSDRQVSIYRELRWLPASDQHGIRTLKSAKECRDQDAQLLAGLVLPLLDFNISNHWRPRLGWDDPIPHTILLAQLRQGVDQGDQKIVDAVLSYIRKGKGTEQSCEALKNISCVLTSTGQFVKARKTFHTGCGGLQPYLYNVDRVFWIEHEPLLVRLGIREKPELEDLLMIQEGFPAETCLNDRDIPVAIEVSRLASAFPRSRLSSLKILDDTGRLRAIQDVTFHDLGFSKATKSVNSTHPDIPNDVIKALQIEPLSQRVKKGELGIADDDEFDQHEDVATGIADTLDRYSIESTFKEFLANADDCGSAEELNWLLDERNHAKKYLVTQELQEYQGPALLVHNDGGK
jgi:sacsin